MQKILTIGRRKNDVAVMFDLDREVPRGIARADTRFVGWRGVALEEIPVSRNGQEVAMILVHRDWDAFYFVNERPDWKDDQYFEFAVKRFKELGIEKP
jgi:hypothetical protein